jgi:DeoR family transcriptional regulator, aga operon transcriptional repressor
MKNSPDYQSTVMRRAKILELLNENGQVLVPDLSNTFTVSEVTIRNDLDHLAKQNMLIRARGGAIRINNNTVRVDLPITDKEKENIHQKQLIGKFASSLVSDGESIIIDSGTTTTELAKNLISHNNLTIITNALNIANMLAERSNFDVIMPGGFLRRNSMCLCGSIGEENMKSFFCDKFFLGVDGFDVESGLYTPNTDEARLNQQMIKIAKKIIVLADSSKFQRKAFAFIASIDIIDIVVTDSMIQKAHVEALTKAGIEVLIAK